MKKFLSRFFAVVLALALVIPGSAAHAEEKSEDIVILYTNDVHCEVVKNEDGTYSFGYANVAAYKKALEETNEYVVLVDNGDHIQGGPYGVLSQGEWMIDLMNAAGYDFAIPGNHEFDYQIPQLLNCVEAADYPYLSCNFISLEDDEPVFDAYQIVEYGDIKIAFMGISTPETFTKSTPSYFKNEDGEFIYSFCEGDEGQELYDQVQATIDSIEDEGVDYIIALAHLGDDPASEPWTSAEVIANTEGIDILLDGHSHSSVPMTTVQDAAGNDVIVSQTGTKFNAFGQLTITTDGDITTELIGADVATEQDADVTDVIDTIVEASAEELSKVAGTSEYTLYINNPETGLRAIRSQETNAGDFVADAYRATSGAQIAVVNGGGIRVDVPAGDITVELLRNLHPFGNELCVVKTTGAHIADLLEMAVSKLDETGNGENGGFQHVSGMTFKVDLTIPSSVVTSDQGEFVEVSGDRRVFDICVLDPATGAYEPIDLEAEYTLASHNYMLKDGGDGLNMFTGDELLIDGMMLDYEVVMNYFDLCGGSVPAEYADFAGQGRIKIYTDAAEVAAARETADTADVTELPKTGVVSALAFYAIGSAMVAGGFVVSKKNRKED